MDIGLSWLCVQLGLPEPVAKTIRDFLHHPPVFYVEPSDLVLAVSSNYFNMNYAIATCRPAVSA
jgi:hypothetical protein